MSQTQVEENNTDAPDGVDLADGKKANPEENSTVTESASENNTPKDDTENGTSDQIDDPEKAEEQNEPELSPLEQALKESAEFKDSWQRERADFSNYRKRMLHEKSQIRENATGIVIHDLLEALDNLDRVLISKSDNEEVQNFIEGVRMIQNQFFEVLAKHNVIVVAPENQPFDPLSMEAIATEIQADLKIDTVLEVYQVGYVQEMSSGKHVLRPARVKVGKAGNAAQENDNKENDTN